MPSVLPRTDVKASFEGQRGGGAEQGFPLMALQARWTSGVSRSATMVLVQGPEQDEYGDVIDQE